MRSNEFELRVGKAVAVNQVPTDVLFLEFTSQVALNGAQDQHTIGRERQCY